MLGGIKDFQKIKVTEANTLAILLLGASCHRVKMMVFAFKRI